MLNGIIKGYNSLKVKMINKLGDGEEGLLDELDFLDDSLIVAKIDYIKKVDKLVSDEMKEASSDKVGFLIERKNELAFEFAFLASNSIKNIEFCLSILNENDEFKKCLYAVKEYSNGNNIGAIKLFKEYFNNNKYMLEHYLICKIYGELLYIEKDYYNSSMFLRKAIEKRPDEIELHLMLKDIYSKLDDVILLEQENEIINILEG